MVNSNNATQRFRTLLQVPQKIQLVITGVNEPTKKCKYHGSNCIIALDVNVAVETKMTHFDETAARSTANVLMTLAQSNDDLKTNFDWSITGDNADQAPFSDLVFNLVYDMHPTDPILSQTNEIL